MKVEAVDKKAKEPHNTIKPMNIGICIRPEIIHQTADRADQSYQVTS